MNGPVGPAACREALIDQWLARYGVPGLSLLPGGPELQAIWCDLAGDSNYYLIPPCPRPGPQVNKVAVAVLVDRGAQPVRRSADDSAEPDYISSVWQNPGTRKPGLSASMCLKL